MRAASEPDPRALGIDTFRWPGDRKGAQSLFDQMPEQLAGLRVRRPQFHGNSTGVVYGPSDTGVTAWVIGPDKQIKDPRANLSASFGLGSVCSKDSYVGTAPYLRGSTSQWGIPGMESRGAPGADDGQWWFSCKFTAGETTTVTGHAIGWVSGDLAWLVTAPDTDTTELTITALTRARG